MCGGGGYQKQVQAGTERDTHRINKQLGIEEEKERKWGEGGGGQKLEYITQRRNEDRGIKKRQLCTK